MMAGRAVLRSAFASVTRHTPTHSGLLLHLEIFVAVSRHISVTLRAVKARVDVNLMRKLHVLRHIVILEPAHLDDRRRTL